MGIRDTITFRCPNCLCSMMVQPYGTNLTVELARMCECLLPVMKDEECVCEVCDMTIVFKQNEGIKRVKYLTPIVKN